MSRLKRQVLHLGWFWLLDPGTSIRFLAFDQSLNRPRVLPLVSRVELSILTPLCHLDLEDRLHQSVLHVVNQCTMQNR